MRLKERLGILLLSIAITLLGFNFIASNNIVDLLKAGKAAGYEIIANTDINANQIG